MTTIVTLKITILKKNQKGNKGKKQRVGAGAPGAVAQLEKYRENIKKTIKIIIIKIIIAITEIIKTIIEIINMKMVMMDSKLTMVKETWSTGILLPLIALLLILAKDLLSLLECI